MFLFEFELVTSGNFFLAIETSVGLVGEVVYHIGQKWAMD
jgi:hypothetical protein